MSTLKTYIECPHCKLKAPRDVQYDDLGNPFVHKCDEAAGGCGKYFAVKLNLTLKAECCKIFEGAPSGEWHKG